MRAKDALGRYGEAVAEEYLIGVGMRILARNWRCRAGEIDLIAQDGPSVVVCEVKTRRDDTYGGPVQALTPLKLARLKRLAGYWLDEHPGADLVRIDLVAVWAPVGEPVAVEHYAGVA